MSEATEVVERDPRPIAARPANNAATLMQVIENAALNPNVDVEKMERLMGMAERAQDREAERAFNAAMVRAQSAMQPIRKTRQNSHTKTWYADLAQIAIQVNDIFTNEGFALVFSEGETPVENNVRVVCDIMHNEGHTVQRWADVPISTTGTDGKRNMTDTHGKGSGFSYGRRYLTVMIGNIPTPDNDGNTASPVAEKLCITQPQLRTLRNMLEDNDLEVEFLSWIDKERGITRLEDIPREWFADINSMIRERVKGTS